MTADYVPRYTAPPPEGGTAVLYVGDGGEVSCGASAPYRAGHPMTLFYASQADPTAPLLWTERGTWERVTAATLAAYRAMPPLPDGTPYEPTCEACGAKPLT